MVIRRAEILLSRKHRAILYAARTGMAGCLLFVPATALIFAWIAFGDPGVAITARRARRGV